MTCISKVEEEAVSDGTVSEYTTSSTSSVVYSKVQSEVSICIFG